MQKVKTANRVRFAWWGGEEGGLVGSTNYVAGLTPKQVAEHEMYLNFDMVGSPNYGLFRYDGDGSDFGLVGPDGSDEIEALFTRYYTEHGHPSEATPFNGRSDYQAFIANGIPAGGLFTGAEGVKTAAQAAKWGGTAGHRLRPVLPLGLRHDRQRQHQGAGHQLRCDRLRHLPLRHPWRGDQRLATAARRERPPP